MENRGFCKYVLLLFLGVRERMRESLAQLLNVGMRGLRALHENLVA
jgi:hypothetical protein